MLMKNYSFVGDRLREVQARILAAAQKAGRSPENIRILAVTKFHPIDAAHAAYEAGIRLFGENRVQEAQEKYPAFLASHPDAALHMIGHLQGNKVKKAVELFHFIESVDSEALLIDINKRAIVLNRQVDILLELHTGEESKSGFPDRGSVLEACSQISDLKFLRLRGLMTIAPYTNDPSVLRKSFRALHSLFDEIAAIRAFPDMDILSLGMSNDFETAVEEGATILRLGSILFGPRE